VKGGAVYIMANRRNGTIYVGSTAHLVQRTYQHREGLIDGFTKDHSCKLLVWFEVHDDLQEARRRKLQIKKWMRPWKIRLVEEANPDWRDLWFDIRV
jgi:putative endonuclease